MMLLLIVYIINISKLLHVVSDASGCSFPHLTCQLNSLFEQLSVQPKSHLTFETAF